MSYLSHGPIPLLLFSNTLKISLFSFLNIVSSCLSYAVFFFSCKFGEVKWLVVVEII